ncbi:MAG: GSU2203 family decaheme c-type cytochrome [Candidatus Eiseniibacteriota bacterium]|jgi:DmsE family decaheme c-type cytochrome
MNDRSGRPRGHPVLTWIGGVALVALAVGFGAAPPATAEYVIQYPAELSDATFVGNESCMGCHEELGEAFLSGRHGAIRSHEAVTATHLGCESCHGPGSRHADSGEPADIVNPATADAALSSRLCLQCHKGGEAGGFEHSHHALADLACTACHGMHGEQRTALLVDRQPSLCYTCHADVRAQTYLPSHHPIQEGKMVCTDCHDPHARQFQNTLAGERGTDLCFSCHAGYEGPFVFEHAPVVEDCGICHAPHGAVANSLLHQNEPFICLQCHQVHFHATLPGIDGEFTTLDGNPGISTRDGSKSVMMTKCTQCHSQVHGSDLPSQSISGEGGNLTR